MTGPADSAWISARSDDGWYGQLQGPLAIRHVAIQVADSARETMWEVSSPQTCDKSIRRVQYGALPTGFEEVVAPRVLSEGASYELTLTSCDYHEGVLYFSITNGRVEPDNG